MTTPCRRVTRLGAACTLPPGPRREGVWRASGRNHSPRCRAVPQPWGVEAGRHRRRCPFGPDCAKRHSLSRPVGPGARVEGRCLDRGDRRQATGCLFIRAKPADGCGPPGRRPTNRRGVRARCPGDRRPGARGARPAAAGRGSRGGIDKACCRSPSRVPAARAGRDGVRQLVASIPNRQKRFSLIACRAAGFILRMWPDSSEVAVISFVEVF